MELYKSSVGDGPTILLIHGIISDHSYFDAILPYLKQQFRVVCYDRRGYGIDNDFLDTEDFSLATQIIDATKILDGEKTPVIVVAHSAGSLIALGLAKRYPFLVRGLILIEPALGFNEADQLVLKGFHLKMKDLAEKKKILPAIKLVSQAGGESNKAVEKSNDTIKRIKQNLNHFMYRELQEIYGHRENLKDIQALRVPICVGISDTPGAMYASISQHDAVLLGWPTIQLPMGHDCLRSDPARSADVIIKEITKMINK